MELPESKQDRLTALGNVLMAAHPTVADVPIPDDLSIGELHDWLEGAGFRCGSSLTVRGDTVRVYRQTATPGWPEYVTVTLNDQQRYDGEYVVLQHSDRFDLPHDYDPTCHCGDCVDDAMDRHEDAMIRKGGM